MEVIKITVEELEIIVEARVEEALKDFKKLVPTIKEVVKEVQETFDKVDMQGMVKQADTAIKQIKEKFDSVDMKNMGKNVKQAVRQVKQQINNVNGSNLSQLEAQFSKASQSVEKYQQELENTKQKLSEVYAKMDEKQEQKWAKFTPEGLDVKNNPIAEKAIEPVVNESLNKDKGYQNLIKQEEKLNEKVEELNSKLEEAKQNYSQIGAEVEEAKKKQSGFSSIFTRLKTGIGTAKQHLSGFRLDFSKIPNITTTITKHIKSMSTGIKSGIGQVLKYAGALFSLRGIYSVLSSSAQSWLSSQNTGAQQLSANIDYMKYSMGSVFAPIIQYVTNLVYQLMKALQSVIYALFKVNIFANAGATAYANMANSAKKTASESKALAGVHSDINNLSDNNGTGDTGSGIVAPNIDLSGVDTQLSPLSQKLHDFFEPLVESWNTYGASLIEKAKETIGNIGELIESVWGSFENIITNGTVYSILENILGIIGNIAEAFANAWNNNGNGDVIIQNLADMFNNLLGVIEKIAGSQAFQTFLDGILNSFTGISTLIKPIISDLFALLEPILKITLSGIGTILNIVGEALKFIGENELVVTILEALAISIGLVTAALTIYKLVQSGIIAEKIMETAVLIANAAAWFAANIPILLVVAAITAVIAIVILCIKHWDELGSFLSGIWEWIKQTAINIWNAIKDFFVGLWNGIKDVAVSIWEGIKSFFISYFETVKNIFTTVWNAIKDFFVSYFNNVKTIFTTVWNTISGFISGVFDGIKNTISTILNTIFTIWSNIWNGVMNVITSVWNGIWGVIRTVINFILSGIESFVNGIISGINIVLGAISSVASAVGSLIGLNPISLRLNTISLPRLATGNVAYEETLAVFGEYSNAKSNPEITAPQNVLRETFEDVLANNQSNNGQPIKLQVFLGTKCIIDEVIDGINERARQTGKAQIKASYT
ncbi:MAG: hypothetical protein Q4D02_01755 [Clostridia bacterium]|nr:hypothetical protein [Clostridia bacterium]